MVPFIVKMFQSPFRPPEDGEEWIQKNTNPYTFGPHVSVPSTSKKVVCYYPAYNTIITQHPQRIPIKYNDPPAWLVGQWIISKSQGIPISKFAQTCLQHCSDIEILSWLSNIKGIDLDSHNSPNTQEHDA